MLTNAAISLILAALFKSFAIGLRMTVRKLFNLHSRLLAIPVAASFALSACADVGSSSGFETAPSFPGTPGTQPVDPTLMYRAVPTSTDGGEIACQGDASWGFVDGPLLDATWERQGDSQTVAIEVERPIAVTATVIAHGDKRDIYPIDIPSNEKQALADMSTDAIVLCSDVLKAYINGDQRGEFIPPGVIQSGPMAPPQIFVPASAKAFVPR